MFAGCSLAEHGYEKVDKKQFLYDNNNHDIVVAVLAILRLRGKFKCGSLGTPAKANTE